MNSRWLGAGVIVAALLPSGYLAWQARDMPHLGQHHDDGIYWVTAKSLAQGTGYRIVSLPEQPYQTKWPPLYPLLLSCVWRVQPSFPANLPLALLLNWLFLPLFVALAARTYRDLGLGRREGWLLSGMLALSSTVAVLSITLMSDLLFCCLLFVSLSLARRGAEPGSSPWLAVLAGLVAGIGYLTRVAALPLLIAGPAWFLLRKQYARAAFYLAAIAPAVIGWNLWVHVHFSSSNDIDAVFYTNHAAYIFHSLSWRDLPMIAWKNLPVLLLANVQPLIYTAGTSWLADFYARLFALASIAGLIRLSRQTGVTPYHLFAAAYVLLLLAYGWPADGRVILPIFPLLLGGLWVELRHLIPMVLTSLRRRDFAARSVAVAIAAGLVISACSVLYFTGDALFRFLPGTVAQHRRLLAADRQAYQWISQNVPRDQAFLAYDDPLLYLYTGNPARSMHIASGLYYQDRPDAAQQQFYSVADFAHRHKLGYVLRTAGDFYRGELNEDQRLAVKQIVESGFQPLYESAMTCVHRVAPN